MAAVFPWLFKAAVKAGLFAGLKAGFMFAGPWMLDKAVKWFPF